MKFLNTDKYKSLTICLFLLFITFRAAAADDKRPAYVLIINSYTESTPWSRMFTTPIYQRIMTQESTSVYTEHMNVMMMKTEEDVEAFTSELDKKYTGKPPVMIVLLGNSAYALLKDELNRRWGTIYRYWFVREKITSETGIFI